MASQGFGTLYLLCFLCLSTPLLSLSRPDWPDFHDLLPQFGLPRGMLPQFVNSYQLSFSIDLGTPCTVKIDDRHVARYNRYVSGKFSTDGVVSDLEGVQVTLPAGNSVALTKIVVGKNAETLDFYLGNSYYNTYPASQFEIPPVCSSTSAMIKSVAWDSHFITVLTFSESEELASIWKLELRTGWLDE
ncbi:hypothetical protein Tsubulata_010690 [Turnera subulata]|uniref:Uncharacterized protein n=1 Tax=Turnera subulata TaxID=218843 RepID=A0A9Q0GC09_9ROSI|nr:hypothetical protein Tsubulata_010690 [Turnera subulata]